MTSQLARLGAVATFACTFVCTSSLWSGTAVWADPNFNLAVDGTSVTLAKACNPAEPIATLHARIRNSSALRSAAQHFTVRDASGALSGTGNVPPLAPGASTSIDVPLEAVDATHLAGKRSLSLYLGSAARPAAPEATVLDLPLSFCRVGANQLLRSTAPLALPTPATDPRAISAYRNIPVAHMIAVMPPLHVRAGVAASDCAGLIPRADCNAIFLSGRLMLLWQPPDNGASDGYRVYGVDKYGNDATLLASAEIPGQTGVIMPAIREAYTGHCYAVSTMLGTRESTRGDPFCATDDSFAKTILLRGSADRSAVKNHASSSVFDDFPTHGPVVGFRYSTDKHTFSRDDFGNAIHRSGFAFDIASHVGHRLVRARLHLTILTSQGMGNNFSCANNIGTGTEFWWKPDANSWIDGDFSSPATPPTTGPEIVTDVTTLASPWFSGAPNYGFVVRNTDENLNAFTEKECETTYEYPTLELTYF